MPLSEQEEFELLSLERERAGQKPAAPVVPEEPGMMDKAQMIVGSLPQSMAATSIQKGINKANKMWEGAAYDVGGKVTDLAAGHVPPQAAAALGFGTNVGMQAIPSILGMFTGRAAAPAMESGAKRLMQSAVKPNQAARMTGKADKAIGTMLDEGINATHGGMAKVEHEIAKADQALAAIIANSKANVDVNQAANRALDVLKKARNQVNPDADVRAVLNSIDEFLNNPAVAKYTNGMIPVQEAQALKQGTYQTLGSKAYGEVKTADMETQKALARGLKEEIATAAPEVKPVNERLSNLLNVEEVLAPRVSLEGNKNPIGLGSLSPSTAHLLTWLMDRSPWVKSMLARGMYSGSEAIPEAVGAAAGGLVGKQGGKRETERP